MEFEHAGLKVEINQDEDSQSPRLDDNLSRMVCFHSRYDLGDKDHEYDTKDYAGWDEMKAAIIRKEKTAFILPLYLYDHSGLAISTGREYPFNCPWDSGQIGFVFVSKAAIRKEFGRKTTQEHLERALKAMLAEVKLYDMYLQGDIWEYEVKDAEGEVLGSCYGYYGQEDCIADAKTAAEFCTKKQAEKIKDATGQLLFAFAKE